MEDGRTRTPWICLLWYMYLFLCSTLVYLIVIVLYDFGRGESTLVGRLCEVGTCNRAMVCLVLC